MQILSVRHRTAARFFKHSKENYVIKDILKQIFQKLYRFSGEKGPIRYNYSESGCNMAKNIPIRPDRIRLPQTCTLPAAGKYLVWKWFFRWIFPTKLYILISKGKVLKQKLCALPSKKLRLKKNKFQYLVDQQTEVFLLILQNRRILLRVHLELAVAEIQTVVQGGWALGLGGESGDRLHVSQGKQGGLVVVHQGAQTASVTPGHRPVLHLRPITIQFTFKLVWVPALALSFFPKQCSESGTSASTHFGLPD